MDAWRLYWRMVGLSIRGQLQYRASFVMFTIGDAMKGFIEYLGIWAFFGRFGTLGEWTLAEAGVFFGMVSIAFAITELLMRALLVFSGHVRNGDFDRLLVRPRGTLLQLMGTECQLIRIGRLLQGVAVLAVSLGLLQVTWGWDRWLLLLLSIASGAFLFAGIIVLQATSCFWTIESLEAWNALTYGGVSTLQYPLSIYPRFLRYLFTYVVPLAALSYWPCAYLLDRGYASPWLSWLSPAIGVLFFAVSTCVWRYGERHYRSTGS